MAETKVLIAVQSQLLLEMLTKVILKLENVAVVQETNDPKHLSDAINQADPDWVILSTDIRKNAAEWIDTLIHAHPTICFVEIALDRDQATIHRLYTGDLEVSNLTLEDFIDILESGCLCKPSKDWIHGLN